MLSQNTPPSFGYYLKLKRLEMSQQRGKKVRLEDMAAHLEKEIANPLITVSKNKLCDWECDRQTPNDKIQQEVKKVLG